MSEIIDPTEQLADDISGLLLVSRATPELCTEDFLGDVQDKLMKKVGALYAEGFFSEWERAMFEVVIDIAIDSARERGKAEGES